MTQAIVNNTQNFIETPCCNISWSTLMTTVAAIAIAAFGYLSYTGSLPVFVATINPYFGIAFVVGGLALAFFCQKSESATALPAGSHPKLIEMQAHVTNTRSYCQRGMKGFDMVTIFKPLNLHECACANTGAYSRLTGTLRDEVENGIVKRLVETFPKEEEISLLSLGSGGLMSDFITLEKLVLAGFKKIKIDCVDPLGIDAGAVDRINQFFKEYPEVKVEMSGCKELPGEGAYSAVLAVDFEPMFDYRMETSFKAAADIMAAKRLLNDRGFMALTFSDEQSFLGRELTPMSRRSGKSILLTMALDMAKELKNEEEISIAIPKAEFTGAHCFFASLALALEQRGRAYKQMNVTCLYDDQKLDELMKLLETLFPSTSLNISPFQSYSKDKVFDLLYTGVKEPIFTSKEYLKLLKEDSLTYILGEYMNGFREKGNLGERRIQIR